MALAFTKSIVFSRVLGGIMMKYFRPLEGECIYTVRGAPAAPVLSSVQHWAFISFSALASLGAAASHFKNKAVELEEEK